ncbi:MAG: hypothetical protein COW24_00840 [Candidatus Kerfeldbacteria bacterium CG15_BIG_FIL_POST_REV_8_21_14_020_45_12]|uniref:Uncharacterized protein n=1 Tax=Candidatus Kerfeldbacteria bacterium CG15_BIG_FIL_POST_REV_8_21_14_020_45_12 TaxID=2014247 RepID=A0A2M7H523_9BACT|nr:MAG: hypothetical protein COW24_00840 [Candidatus Kerfeldbacteria bacterium CG15_BIG_FIL_POST_REV_8_21_14_020_45_12]PJA93189.1 MAG: hypothetical protein CO132_04375 [Candidatus Kerfeldbacteria bacterium CG_4_9_14_3_um_filter_45_8]
MTKDQLKSSVLKRIKTDQLSPKPHWQFTLREGLMWTLGTVAVFIGSVAVAVIIYLVSSSDLDLLLQASGNPIADLFKLFPYFWLILLALFVLLARYQVMHTKRGYRYSVWLVAISLVTASIIIGAFFSFTGIGQQIDQAFEQRLPMYSDLLAPRHDVWCPSEGGRLGGMVLEVVDSEHFRLIDINGNEWIVDLTEIQATTADITPREVVRMLGELGAEGVFEASLIRVKPLDTPFGPKGRFEERMEVGGRALPPGARNIFRVRITG